MLVHVSLGGMMPAKLKCQCKNNDKNYIRRIMVLIFSWKLLKTVNDKNYIRANNLNHFIKYCSCDFWSRDILQLSTQSTVQHHTTQHNTMQHHTPPTTHHITHQHNHIQLTNHTIHLHHTPTLNLLHYKLI